MTDVLQLWQQKSRSLLLNHNCKLWQAQQNKSIIWWNLLGVQGWNFNEWNGGRFQKKHVCNNTLNWIHQLTFLGTEWFLNRIRWRCTTAASVHLRPNKAGTRTDISECNQYWIRYMHIMEELWPIRLKPTEVKGRMQANPLTGKTSQAVERHYNSHVFLSLNWLPHGQKSTSWIAYQVKVYRYRCRKGGFLCEYWNNEGTVCRLCTHSTC